MKLIAFASFVFLASFVFAQNESKVYDFPDIEAEFPGGSEGLQNFIVDNIQYPKEAIDKNITGKVYVSFIVQANGAITDVRIEKGVHPSLDAETIRVIRAIPRWKPGEAEGKKVATRCRLPIVYTLTDNGDEPKKKRKWWQRR